MSIESLKDALPDYARDLKLNLSSLAQETLLTEQQRAGTFIACALASRERTTTNAILTEFAPGAEFGQIDLGGADHPDVQVHLLIAANTPEATVL